MNKETHQISDVMPVDADLLDGEFSLQGDFSISQSYGFRVGDLYRGGFELSSDFGNAKYLMLGKQCYYTSWEDYKFKKGFICMFQVYQPIIQLHFQLDGTTRDMHMSMAYDLDFHPGEVNLIIIPALSGRFELKKDISASTFDILFSKNYLMDLYKRFPHYLDPVLAKLKEKDLCVISERNVRITPRMQSVIQRLRSHNDGHAAGSLFLEAQILDLLAQVFAEMDQPSSSDGHSLSSLDLDRIHRAGEIIHERLDRPPTLAQLARLVGTNEFKLKRGFKEVFGTSPYAYHLQHKLELARSYILDTDHTIAEIAYRVGYSDPAHLTNAFRKQYGIRPSDLR